MEQLSSDLKVYADYHLFSRQTKKWMVNNQTDSYENVGIACPDFVCGFFCTVCCTEFVVICYTIFIFYTLCTVFCVVLPKHCSWK